jgi:hypothetical protein
MESPVKLRFPPANRDFAKRELHFDTPHGSRRHRKATRGRESLVLEAGSHEESIRIAADDFVRIAGAQPADICEDYPATSS